MNQRTIQLPLYGKLEWLLFYQVKRFLKGRQAILLAQPAQPVRLDLPLVEALTRLLD
jgi:hypothetical protein